VSLDTGRIVDAPAEPGTADQVVEYIVPSTQEPVTMPLFPVGGEWLYDGGVRVGTGSGWWRWGRSGRGKWWGG
jgi:hypothetical protein